MSSTDLPQPDPGAEDDADHHGLVGKLDDAIETVKHRIRQYHDGPHELDS